MKLPVIFLAFILNACVSFSGEKEVKVPKIEEKMPLADALSAGIDFGDETLKSVKKLISKRKEWTVAEDILFSNILKHGENWQGMRMINALHLYQQTEGKRAPELFKQMVHSEQGYVQNMAWELAASLPSPKMGVEVEARLTEALADDEVEEVLVPKMAEAVANNRLVHSYTFLRQGLLELGDVAFARAMIVLDARKSAHDFLDYLALAPIEELRQLNLKSVDLFTCTEILQHLMVAEVSISHPHFDSLFNFSVSRNNALGEMARKVLDVYFPKYSQNMAFMLARTPTWMQVAFIEKARNRMNPILGIFLANLKNSTSQKEVIEEINTVKSDFNGSQKNR